MSLKNLLVFGVLAILSASTANAADCPAQMRSVVKGKFCGPYQTFKTGDIVTDGCFNVGIRADQATYETVWNIVNSNGDAALVFERADATLAELTSAMGASLEEAPCLCVQGTAKKDRSGFYLVQKVTDVLTCGTNSRPFISLRNY